MNEANILMLETAAGHLEELADEVVFVGGATLELWLTDEAAPEFRPTNDVDIVVEITSQIEFYCLDERLKAIGFRNHPEGGLICRSGIFA